MVAACDSIWYVDVHGLIIMIGKDYQRIPRHLDIKTTSLPDTDQLIIVACDGIG